MMELRANGNGMVHGSMSEAPKDPASESKPRVAFVLSGGGTLGSLQVGVLEALFEYGVYPDMVVGTSVGALNGVWIARDPTMSGLETLKDIWASLSSNSIFAGNRLRVLLRMLMGRESLYPDKGVRSLVMNHLGDISFEDLSIPLLVTAANLDTAELEVFGQGKLLPAILASTAIPGVFPAVSINGYTYVDGGILAHSAIETAWRQGATHVVAIECPQLPPAAAYGILGPLSKALWVSLRSLRHHAFELARAAYPTPTLRLGPQVATKPRSSTDFSKTNQMMEQAKAWTVKYLQEHSDSFLQALRRQPRPLPHQAPAPRPEDNPRPYEGDLTPQPVPVPVRCS